MEHDCVAWSNWGQVRLAILETTGKSVSISLRDDKVKPVYLFAQ